MAQSAIEIGEELGQGEFGTVYRARDRTLDRDLAVKFFVPEAFGGLPDPVNHVKLLAKIQHENVVSIFALDRLVRPGSSEPEQALVMEFVPGQKLSDWLASSAYGHSDAVSVLNGVLNGLEAFHNGGLAHGDLHAGNIMVSGKKVKLIDPFHHHPQAMSSTMAARDRQNKDLRDMRSLVEQLLDGHGSAPLALHRLAEAPTGRFSIVAFRSFLAQVGSAPAPRSVVLSSYRRLREIQARTNAVEWQEARKDAIRRLQPAFDQWREEVGNRYQESSDVLPLLHDLLNRAEPSLAMMIAAAESANGMHRSDLGIIESLVNVSWPQSGRTNWIEVPCAIGFFGVNWAGAAAAVTGESQGLDVAEYLAEYGLFMPNSPDRRPVRQRSELVGYPMVFDGHWPNSLSALTGSFDHCAILREAFASKGSFLEGIAAFNLVCCVLSYADQFKQDPTRSMAIPMEHPPFACRLPPAAVRSARRSVFASGYYRRALGVRQIDPAELDKDWAEWMKRVCERYLHGSNIHIPETLLDSPARG